MVNFFRDGDIDLLFKEKRTRKRTLYWWNRATCLKRDTVEDVKD